MLGAGSLSTCSPVDYMALMPAEAQPCLGGGGGDSAWGPVETLLLPCVFKVPEGPASESMRASVAMGWAGMEWYGYESTSFAVRVLGSNLSLTTYPLMPLYPSPHLPEPQRTFPWVK